jgi:hypothetical protein
MRTIEDSHRALEETVADLQARVAMPPAPIGATISNNPRVVAGQTA